MAKDILSRHGAGSITFLLLVLLAMPAASSEGRESGLGGRDVRVPLQWIDNNYALSTAQKLAPGNYGRQLECNSRKRFYEIHVPPGYDGTKPLPVVLVFHGGGGYPAAVRYESGMDAVSNRNDFVVVYPGGTPATKLFTDRLLIWDDGRHFKDGSAIHGEDIAFIEALLADLPRLLAIDLSRVYACGISNGAQFSYQLANHFGDRIAAIAAVAGQRAPGTLGTMPSCPVSVMQFSGKKDIYGPYDGGKPCPGKGMVKVKFETNLEPVGKVIEKWVAFNHCNPRPKSKRVGQAVQDRYLSADGIEVVLWTLEDGGHTWPGGKTLPAEDEAGVGHINQDVCASNLIWDFFKAHRLK